MTIKTDSAAGVRTVVVGGAGATGETAAEPLGTARMLGLLAGLYTSQGMVHAFFARSLPVLLRQQGASLEMVGFSYLVFLPWSFNFLWAPLVDRWYVRRLGRRRSWLLPIQVCLVAVLGFVAFGQAELAIAVLVGAAILASVLAATGDIAIDGYAVDRISPAMRGPANGIQIGGYWVGMLIGGSLVLLIIDKTGLAAGIGAMAVVVLLIFLALAATREPPPDAEGSIEDRRPSLWAFVKRPEARLMVLMIFFARFGASFSNGMLQPYLVDVGMDLSDIATLMGVAGVGGSLAGCLVGSLIVRLLRRRTALIAACSLQALALMGYWAIAASGSTSLLAFAIAVEYFCTSLVFVALYTVMMDCCDPRQAGTDFTIQSCAGNLVTILGGVFSGWSAEALGYANHFLIGFLITLGCIAAVAILHGRITDHLSQRETQPCPV